MGQQQATGKSFNITINIESYSSPEDQSGLIDAFRTGGHDGLVEAVQLGPNGKPPKTEIDPQDQTSEGGRRHGLKHRIVEKKTEEYEDYAKQIVALAQVMRSPIRRGFRNSISKENEPCVQSSTKSSPIYSRFLIFGRSKGCGDALRSIRWGARRAAPRIEHADKRREQAAHSLHAKLQLSEAHER
jgi:hypothetical protein